MSWLTELKAGDKVIVGNWCFRGTSYRLSKVEKITPKGFIKVDSNLFNPKTGNIRDTYGDCWLLDYNDEETKEQLEQFQKEKYISSVFGMIPPLNRITYEQAKQIAEILGIEVEEE